MSSHPTLSSSSLSLLTSCAFSWTVCSCEQLSAQSTWRGVWIIFIWGKEGHSIGFECLLNRRASVLAQRNCWGYEKPLNLQARGKEEVGEAGRSCSAHELDKSRQQRWLQHKDTFLFSQWQDWDCSWNQSMEAAKLLVRAQRCSGILDEKDFQTRDGIWGASSQCSPYQPCFHQKPS